jgi:hypothetical protein
MILILLIVVDSFSNLGFFSGLFSWAYGIVSGVASFFGL